MQPHSSILPRGVHSYQEQPSGATVYVAITSTGALLNEERRRRHPTDEAEAYIVREMWRDLNRQDPVSGHSQLSLGDVGPLRLLA